MCMVDGADTDWTPFATVERRARKEHRCGECGRTIEPGESYWILGGVAEGTIYRTKTCAHCKAGPCAWLVKHCRGYLLEGVLEDIEEHWDYPDPALGLGGMAEVGRLLVSMRRRWRRHDGAMMAIPRPPA